MSSANPDLVAAGTPARLSPLQMGMALGLLWLSGAGLRLTLLVVPPLIPLIHADLHLTETEIGTLGSLPSLLFACAAVPGSLLIARFGARGTLVAGLLLTALASAARGAASDVVTLYGATVLMGAGVAIMQPALPPLVRAWLPQRIGFATAVYTNGLLVSETLAVALTLPLVLPLVGGSWRLAFVAWGVPVLATALLVATLAPRQPPNPAAVPARWWPDWKNPLVWRLALMLGGVNADYFATNTFLPDYLHALGRGDLVNEALTALNLSQLPASILMLGLTGRLAVRHWPYVGLGLVLVASVLGMMLLPGPGIVICAAVLGGVNAIVLIMLLALPALLAPAGDAHRVSAAMFTLSYPCAVVLTILGGALWDKTGVAALAFLPVAFGALGIAAFAPGLDFGRLGGTPRVD